MIGNINGLIYLVYPAMLVILLAGSKYAKKGEWNDEFMSLRQTKAFQGFTALCIMFHHLGQKTCADWLDKKYIVPGLEFFVPIGYCFVGIFLFCSGYGLYKSHVTKPDYPGKGFFKHRILPIIVIYYITGFIYLLVRLFVVHEKMTDKLQILWYATGLQLSNPYGWYVCVVPFFYLCFYFAYRYCKKDRAALLIVVIFTFLYTLLGTFINHNDWWMRGEWWYNCIHLFWIGLLFATYEEKIVGHIKRHFRLYLILTFVLIFVFYIASLFAQAIFGYYGEMMHAPDTVLRRWICLISQILTSTAFVAFVFILQLKLRIGNKLLAFMGTMTLEFYLIHGLFIELFCYTFDDGDAKPLYYIKSNVLLTLVTIALAIPAALLLRQINRKIFRGHS